MVIVGDNLAKLVSLAASLQSAFRVTWTIETSEPVERLRELTAPPAAVVFYFSGRENVADIRILANRFPDTAFVFISSVWPPHAPMARAAAGGGLILGRHESSVVIEAALVALLAQSPAATA